MPITTVKKVVALNNLGGDFTTAGTSPKIQNNSVLTGTAPPTGNPPNVNKIWFWLRTDTKTVTHYWDLSSWVSMATSGGSSLQFQDEATNLGTATADTVNLVGTGVTGSRTGNTIELYCNTYTDIATVRSYNASLVNKNKMIAILDAGKEGIFEYDPTDTTTADNTGTVLVTASNARYKRIMHQEILSSWFDATDAGFQKFVDASVGRIGVVNQSQTLTTTINIPKMHLKQWHGVTLTSSANVGFYINLKKGITFDGFTAVGTNTNFGSCVLKIEGLWDSSFNDCSITSAANQTDLVQILAGTYSAGLWGTYKLSFNNFYGNKGRYAFKIDGQNTGLRGVTTVYINKSWLINQTNSIKATNADGCVIDRSSLETPSSHAIDMTDCDNWVFSGAECSPVTGYVINQNGICNKTTVDNALSIFAITSNRDLIGLYNNKVIVQGSNVDSDNYQFKMESAFNYGDTARLEAKGGSSAWQRLLSWSETLGLKLQAGFSQFITLAEDRIAWGITSQFKRRIRSLTCTPNQSQEFHYINLNATVNSLQARIRINYRSDDGAFCYTQEYLYTQTKAAVGNLLYNLVLIGSNKLGSAFTPNNLTAFGGATGTVVGITHTNVNTAGKFDFEVTYSATTAVTMS